MIPPQQGLSSQPAFSTKMGAGGPLVQKHRLKLWALTCDSGTSPGASTRTDSAQQSLRIVLSRTR